MFGAVFGCHSWRGSGGCYWHLAEARDDAEHPKMHISPQERIFQLQMSTVPLLRNPATGVGWLFADLGWPRPGQLGQLG